MNVRVIISIGILISSIIIGCSAADQGSNVTVSNGTVAAQTVQPNEALMNLARDARAYALENGKMTAKSAFSDQASFVRGTMHIAAYDTKGVLLADPFRPEKIGTSGITDDHDTGIVRQLRDIAQAGGGFLESNATETSGLSYYVLDIDGSWWLVAISGK